MSGGIDADAIIREATDVVAETSESSPEGSALLHAWAFPRLLSDQELLAVEHRILETYSIYPAGVLALKTEQTTGGRMTIKAWASVSHHH